MSKNCKNWLQSLRLCRELHQLITFQLRLLKFVNSLQLMESLVCMVQSGAILESKGKKKTFIFNTFNIYLKE